MTLHVRSLLRFSSENLLTECKASRASIHPFTNPVISDIALASVQLPGGDNAGSLDNKSASLLCFEGPASVHGFYNWLLDSVLSTAAETTDVPLLLAPAAFLGASLQELHPQVTLPTCLSH